MWFRLARSSRIGSGFGSGEAAASVSIPAAFDSLINARRTFGILRATWVYQILYSTTYESCQRRLAVLYFGNESYPTKRSKPSPLPTPQPVAPGVMAWRKKSTTQVIEQVRENDPSLTAVVFDGDSIFQLKSDEKTRDLCNALASNHHVQTVR